MRRGGWKVKNWEIEGGGGPWSIEGGDLGSGGLSGGCDGFTTPFTATNQPNPESLAENVPWPVTEFEAFFCDILRISGTSPDPISHKYTHMGSEDMSNRNILIDLTSNPTTWLKQNFWVFFDI